MIIRQAISSVKKKLKEVNADSRATNKFIYTELINKANIIIQRDSDALRLTNLEGVYQSLKCINVKKVPAIDKSCYVSSKKVMYRTTAKIPDLYYDGGGPIIKNIRSIDRSTSISFVTQNSLYRTLEDKDSRYDNTIYAFFEEGYLYITKNIPIIVEGFFVSDVSDFCNCECDDKKSPCSKFLDREWYIPKKLSGPIIDAVVQDLAGTYKRIPDQVQFDKNPNT